MSPVDSLTAVRRAALRREEAEHRFRGAIFTANAAGHSLRKIGAAAGVSHTRVLQIVRGETVGETGRPYVEELDRAERQIAAECSCPTRPCPIHGG